MVTNNTLNQQTDVKRSPTLVMVVLIALCCLLVLLLRPASLGLNALSGLQFASRTAESLPDKPFDCLSYAPFRNAADRPDKPGVYIPGADLQRDLGQIAGVTSCIRLYGTANGLDAVPAIARSLGLRVWLGVWLGSDAALNAAEMDRALLQLQQFPDVIDRVIVGSEVLLRGELPVNALTATLDEFRARMPVQRPVAYADVWEFWLQHRIDLQDHVDEALIHVLPYWENDPIALPDAPSHVLQVWRDVSRRLDPLPVIVGEAGWPAAGRMRGGARPGAAEQLAFVKELLQLKLADSAIGRATPVINIIEAFDQPWKASLEGIAGASWGVLGVHGFLKPAFKGGLLLSVWPFCIVAAVAAVLTLVAVLFLHRRGRAGESNDIAAQAAHAPMQTQVESAAITKAPPANVFLLLAVTFQSLLISWPLQQWWLLDIASAGAMLRLCGMAVSCGWYLSELLYLLSRIRGDAHATWLPTVRSACLWLLSAYAVWLLADGRYLDLPWELLMGPAILLSLSTWRLNAPLMSDRLVMARSGLLVGSAVSIMQVERWTNTDAVMMVVFMVMLAVGAARRKPV